MPKFFEKLTDREKQVLNHVVGGETNPQIAEALGIEVVTVKVHRSRIMDKVGAGNGIDLVRMFHDRVIIPKRLIDFAGFLKAVARNLDMHPTTAAVAVLAGANQLANIYTKGTTDPKSAAKQFQKSRAAPLATAPPNVKSPSSKEG